MPELTGMLLLVVVLALLFDFSNGWHDSANAIATVVSTRVISPFVAVIVAGLLNVAGAFMSTAVAKMVGSGIVDPAGVTQHMVAAALAGAILLEPLHADAGLADQLLARAYRRDGGGCRYARRLGDRETDWFALRLGSDGVVPVFRLCDRPDLHGRSSAGCSFA